MQNFCNWAVVARCSAKNNGIDTTFFRVIGVFNYPYQADEFIEKCLPVENRACFFKQYLPDVNKKWEEIVQPNAGKRECSSKARIDGNCNYRLWTTEELISGYSWEMHRNNQDDAKQTKELIKAELKRRFDATLNLLEDEQTKDNPLGTYLYLLNVNK